jgi:transcriptional regulator with XRE-family HTH domain
MQVQFKVRNIKQLGAVSKLVRQSQSLVQETAGLLSGNGLTFISQFENGKETVEIGRVLNLLEQLGIDLEINLPPNLPEETIDKLKKLLNMGAG